MKAPVPEQLLQCVVQTNDGLQGSLSPQKQSPREAMTPCQKKVFQLTNSTCLGELENWNHFIPVAFPFLFHIHLNLESFFKILRKANLFPLNSTPTPSSICTHGYALFIIRVLSPHRAWNNSLLTGGPSSLPQDVQCLEASRYTSSREGRCCAGTL